MPKIIIVGGGIAGLATAWYLQQRSAAAGVVCDYTLLERDQRLGGTIVTQTQDELVIEGGPDSFVTQKPWGLQLCRELGLEEELMPINEKPVAIIRGGRQMFLPSGFRLMAPTNISSFLKSPLFSPWGKLRMMCEPFIPRRQESGDESVADFLRRRVGQECLERVAGPLMAGIYVSEPEKLSMASTFGMFHDLEKQHGSLIRGLRMSRKRKPAPGAFRSPFATLKGGMGRLVSALRDGLTGTIREGVSVATVLTTPTGPRVVLTTGEVINGDAVVLATPAHLTAKLVQDLDPELASALRGIGYVSTATVSLAWRKSELPPTCNLNTLGFIVPAVEQRRLLACTFSSSKFKHRAPEDLALLRVFLGGLRHEELVDREDAELVTLCRDELRDLLGITAAPLTTQVFRWPKANPQYEVGHMERIEAIEALAARTPGLFLTGSAYRGIGIPGCVGSAQRTVDLLCKCFHPPVTTS